MLHTNLLPPSLSSLLWFDWSLTDIDIVCPLRFLWAVRTGSSHCLCCPSNKLDSCPCDRRERGLAQPEHHLQSGYILLFSALLRSLPLEPHHHSQICILFHCMFNHFMLANQQEKKPVKTSLLTSHIFEADGVGCLNITQTSCQSIQCLWQTPDCEALWHCFTN